MNEILNAVANDLTQNNKYIKIPAGSVLSTLNPTVTAEGGSLDGLDNKLANILSNEINNIKNKIIPAIKEYGMLVTQAVNAKNNVNPLENVNIYYAEIPDFVNELISRGVINTKIDRPLPLDNKNTILPTPSPEKIREYLVYGAGQMEAMINSFVKTIDNDTLVKIWDKYLGRISADNPNYMSLGFEVCNGIYGLDLFVLSIIVKNLKTKLPEGVRISESEYSRVINNLDILLDSKIGRLNNMIESNIAIGKLVYKAESINEVIVIRETYYKFIEDGGLPEAIYGAILGGAKTMSVTTAMNDKDKYVDAWNKYVKGLTVQTQLASLDNHRLAYRICLTTIINDFLDEESLDLIPARVLNNINEIIVNYLNTTPNEELFNITKTVENIITGILYGHTNAAEFISYMKHYSATNPSLTAKEAATFASCDLVVSYLLTQINIG